MLAKEKKKIILCRHKQATKPPTMNRIENITHDLFELGFKCVKVWLYFKTISQSGLEKECSACYAKLNAVRALQLL